MFAKPNLGRRSIADLVYLLQSNQEAILPLVRSCPDVIQLLAIAEKGSLEIEEKSECVKSLLDEAWCRLDNLLSSKNSPSGLRKTLTNDATRRCNREQLRLPSLSQSRNPSKKRFSKSIIIDSYAEDANAAPSHSYSPPQKKMGLGEKRTTTKKYKKREKVIHEDNFQDLDKSEMQSYGTRAGTLCPRDTVLNFDDERSSFSLEMPRGDCPKAEVLLLESEVSRLIIEEIKLELAFQNKSVAHKPTSKTNLLINDAHLKVPLGVKRILSEVYDGLKQRPNFSWPLLYSESKRQQLLLYPLPLSSFNLILGFIDILETNISKKAKRTGIEHQPWDLWPRQSGKRCNRDRSSAILHKKMRKSLTQEPETVSSTENIGPSESKSATSNEINLLAYSRHKERDSCLRGADSNLETREQVYQGALFLCKPLVLSQNEQIIASLKRVYLGTEDVTTGEVHDLRSINSSSSAETFTLESCDKEVQKEVKKEEPNAGFPCFSSKRNKIFSFGFKPETKIITPFFPNSFVDGCAVCLESFRVINRRTYMSGSILPTGELEAITQPDLHEQRLPEFKSHSNSSFSLLPRAYHSVVLGKSAVNCSTQLPTDYSLVHATGCSEIAKSTLSDSVSPLHVVKTDSANQINLYHEKVYTLHKATLNSSPPRKSSLLATKSLFTEKCKKRF